MPTILPGATIGFLGGGQLGRMTAFAARSMGYEVHVLDPDPAAPARAVASRFIESSFDDADSIVRLAEGCAVLMPEIETISAEGMARAIAHAPVRPGAQVLHVIQDRARQKQWLANQRFPLTPFHLVSNDADCAAATALLTGPCFVKTATGGYDGRGQARAQSPSGIGAAWASLGRRPVVVEQAVEIAMELSVMVARAPSGAIASYPPAANHHVDGILAWSVIPGVADEAIATRARELANAIAEAIAVEGLLCVEMFLATSGALLVNELAPRPHNSYHESIEGCATSQFEQAVRAICGLPLGDTRSLRPAAIANLLGELWPAGILPDFAGTLASPLTRLHLYGKQTARAGRKMGHLAATGETPAIAVHRAVTARNALAMAVGVAPWTNAGP